VEASVGTAPFFNIVVPYVTGTAQLTGVTGPSTLPANFNLASLVTIDPATGKVTYDTSSFQFLAQGETAVYTIKFDSYGGPATANLSSNEPYTVHTTLTLTLVGLNDAPVFTASGTYQYTGSYADALNDAAHALVGDTTGTTPLISVLLAERPAVTGSGAADTATIVLNFTDQDFSDVTSGYLSSGHMPVVHFVGASGVTSGLPADPASALAASLSIDSLTKGLNDIHGQLTASFTAPDHLFDYLAAGESVTLSYTIQITDKNGATGTETVNIVVTGTNDVPTLVGASEGAFSPTDGAITERACTTDSSALDTASGAIAFADADLSDTHAVTVTGVTACGITTGLPDDATVKGWLTLGALSDSTGTGSGSDGWTLAAADKYFDYLRAGETLTLSYTVQVDDHHGGLVSQVIEITITGSNDAAVIGEPDVASVTEDQNVDCHGNLVASGHLFISDADHGQSTFQTDVFAHEGDLGTLILQPDGSYTYSVSNAAVQCLGADQTRTDTFTVTSADGTTKDVAFEIHGVNDAPVIDLDHLCVYYADEDQIRFSGLHVSDVDATSTEIYRLQTHVTYGALSPHCDSGTIATIDGDLAAGFVYQTNEADEEHVETVTVSVTDGHGASDSLNFIFSTADFPTAQVVLNGTSGKDVFIGSDVAEQFVFAAHSGNDTIVNFTAGGDKIDLSSTVTTNDLDGWISQHATGKGSDTLITIDSQDSILLKNVAVTSLHASDFIVGHS
jgi:VCBS repeat-containing protein